MRKLMGLVTACAVLAVAVGASAGERSKSKHARNPIRLVAGGPAFLNSPWAMAQAPPAPGIEGAPVAPEPAPAYPTPAEPMPMGEPGLAPIPEGAIPYEAYKPADGQLPPEGEIVYEGPAMPLFTNLEVEDRDNIHPCAVPTIVPIADPCAPKCSGPSCVYVEICVPPCECKKVKYSKDGRKAKYDYGEYTVELESEDGVVKVDYDD